MKQIWQLLAAMQRWMRILVNPPSVEAVNNAYTTLRKDYVLSACCQHFGKNMAEPAPLYGLKLLDVGCGQVPDMAAFLALAGADVTAIDPDLTALEGAQKAADAYGVPVTFYPNTLEELVSENNVYDIILTLDILEYVDDIDRFIWAQDKLLQKNGLVVFSGIRRTVKAWLMHVVLSSYILGRTLTNSRHWHGFYRLKTLRALYATRGMNVVSVQGLKFHLVRKKWHLSKKPDTRYLGTATRI